VDRPGAAAYPPPGRCPTRLPACFAILVFALGCASTADDRAACQKADAREALGPVRFQDDTSWCFAFAAADLLTYRFRTELKGERVSDVYTALTYTQMYAGDPYSDAGGLARLTIEAAERRGLCPQSVEEEALQRGPLGSLSQKLETLRLLKTLYDRGETAALDRKLEELARSHSIVTAVPRDQLMKALRDSDRWTFPMVFADLLCGSNRYKPLKRDRVKSMIKWVSGRRRMLAAIDQQLSAGNIVAIGYYSDFLLLGPSAPQQNRHMSSLVGRRWNAGRNQCEYLIRNSFGPQCLGYSDAFRTPENCQSGHIWAPRSILEKNLFSLTYIRP